MYRASQKICCWWGADSCLSSHLLSAAACIDYCWMKSECLVLGGLRFPCAKSDDSAVNSKLANHLWKFKQRKFHPRSWTSTFTGRLQFNEDRLYRDEEVSTEKFDFLVYFHQPSSQCIICFFLHGLTVVFVFRSKIELGDITPHNIKQLKRLNTVVFPVSYNEKFYKDVLEAGELAKLGTLTFGIPNCLLFQIYSSCRTRILVSFLLYPVFLPSV